MMAILFILFGGGFAVAALWVSSVGMCEGCFHPCGHQWPWSKKKVVCGFCQLMRNKIPFLDEKLKEQGL